MCNVQVIKFRVKKYRKEKMNLMTRAIYTILNLIYYNTWIYHTQYRYHYYIIT